jgi:hypothetical protein
MLWSQLPENPTTLADKFRKSIPDKRGDSPAKVEARHRSYADQGSPRVRPLVCSSHRNANPLRRARTASGDARRVDCLLQCHPDPRMRPHDRAHRKGCAVTAIELYPRLRVLPGIVVPISRCCDRLGRGRSPSGGCCAVGDARHDLRVHALRCRECGHRRPRLLQPDRCRVQSDPCATA